MKRTWEEGITGCLVELVGKIYPEEVVTEMMKCEVEGGCDGRRERIWFRLCEVLVFHIWVTHGDGGLSRSRQADLVDGYAHFRVDGAITRCESWDVTSFHEKMSYYGNCTSRS